MIMGNTTPNRISCNLSEKYNVFVLEKFLISRTLRIKNQLGILDQAVQRLLYEVAQNITRQLKHKREARRASDNGRTI